MKPPAMPRSQGLSKALAAMTEVMKSAPSRSPTSRSGVGGVGQQHAASGQDQGPFGSGEQVRPRGPVRPVPAGQAGFAGRGSSGSGVRGRGGGEVVGNGQHHGLDGLQGEVEGAVGDGGGVARARPPAW